MIVSRIKIPALENQQTKGLENQPTRDNEDEVR